MIGPSAASFLDKGPGLESQGILFKDNLNPVNVVDAVDVSVTSELSTLSQNTGSGVFLLSVSLDEITFFIVRFTPPHFLFPEFKI